MDRIWKKHLHRALLDAYLEMHNKNKWSKEEVNTYFAKKMAAIEAAKIGISTKGMYSLAMKDIKDSGRENEIL